jgi:exopolyphosphatase/guanosine-5'-triphosphate,3'-diphosphate pyrophosphatase
MRAVIDIGTNSILMLMGETTGDGRLMEVMQKSEITRLGEALQRTGMITQSAMERSEEVLENYRVLLKEKGVTDVSLVATEVLRAAGNRHLFMERIKERFGWEIEVLSGEQEAKYSYLGVMDFVAEPEKEGVVMDVGGGSSEIIVGKGAQLHASQSIPIGAVRLWERLEKKESLSHEEIELAEQIIREYLGRIMFQDIISSESFFIGLGGTITTLVAIEESMEEYNAEIVNGYSLTRDRLKDLFFKLNQLSISERKAVPGLVSGREDIILYGILIFTTFMDLFEINRVIVSDRGLRFGYLKYLESGDRE